MYWFNFYINCIEVENYTFLIFTISNAVLRFTHLLLFKPYIPLGNFLMCKMLQRYSTISSFIQFNINFTCLCHFTAFPPGVEGWNLTTSPTTIILDLLKPNITIDGYTVAIAPRSNTSDIVK